MNGLDPHHAQALNPPIFAGVVITGDEPIGAPDLAYPKPRRLPRLPQLPKALRFVVAFVAAITFWAGFAPRPVHQSVPASSIQPLPISGDVCSGFGGVASAVVVDRAGPFPLVQVTCGNGVVTLTSQP